MNIITIKIMKEQILIILKKYDSGLKLIRIFDINKFIMHIIRGNK